MHWGGITGNILGVDVQVSKAGMWDSWTVWGTTEEDSTRRQTYCEDSEGWAKEAEHSTTGKHFGGEY